MADFETLLLQNDSDDEVQRQNDSSCQQKVVATTQSVCLEFPSAQRTFSLDWSD